MRFSSGQRSLSSRYDVLRQGARYTQLYAVDGAEPSISMSGTAEIKMTLKGIFWMPVLNVNYLTDSIKPYIIIDGVEYPLGVYRFGTVEESYSHAGGQISVEAYDLTYLLKRTSLEQRAQFSDGNRYIDVIQALMIQAGILNILSEDSQERLKTYREDWEIGTTHLTICNELLKEINYNSVWADLNGILRLTRYVPPSVDSINHIYQANDFSVLSEQVGRTTDLFQKYNVFRAEVSSPDYEAPLIATSVNDDPASVISTVNQGRVCAPVEKLNNIASQEKLQMYVDNLKLKSMQINETVNFTTAIMPNHQVGDVIALQNRHISGVFEETEWSIAMKYDGEMTHTARRIQYL